MDKNKIKKYIEKIFTDNNKKKIVLEIIKEFDNEKMDIFINALKLELLNKIEMFKAVANGLNDTDLYEKLENLSEKIEIKTNFKEFENIFNEFIETLNSFLNKYCLEEEKNIEIEKPEKKKKKRKLKIY